MKKNTPKNHTIKKYSSVFNLKDMISMPLKSVIDANAEAAYCAMDIIKKYGFEKKAGDKGFGKLKMASFSYDYKGKDGAIQVMKISIPFLTLIPLPLLEIKKADFKFTAQILECSKEENLHGGKIERQNMQAIFRNSISKDSEFKSNMEVNVSMGQSDLPSGILNLMNIGQEASSGSTSNSVNFSKSYLDFNMDQPCQNMTITFESQKARYIIEVISNDNHAAPSLQNPIEILKGREVGTPSNKKVIVIPIITKKKVLVKMKLTANMALSRNGFIVVKNMQGAILNRIYFKIDSLKDLKKEVKIRPHQIIFKKSKIIKKIKIKNLPVDNTFSIQVNKISDIDGSGEPISINDGSIKITKGNIVTSNKKDKIDINPKKESINDSRGKIHLVLDAQKLGLTKGFIELYFKNELVKSIFFNYKN